jgi:hypothetical protein
MPAAIPPITAPVLTVTPVPGAFPLVPVEVEEGLDVREVSLDRVSELVESEGL